MTVFALDIGFTARYRDHIPVGIEDKPPQKVAPDNAGRSGYERCFFFGVTVYRFLEKVTPLGGLIAPLAGTALIAAGAWLLSMGMS